MPRVASPILTLHDDITITVGGREFQFPKQQVVDREPHSIISHAIEGPWADKEKLSFPDRSGEGFEGLVQYILGGFVPREFDFAALIAVPLNLLVCATVRAFVQVFAEAEYFQFTRLLPISLSNPRADALEEADIHFMLSHHPAPVNLCRLVLAHHSHRGQHFKGADMSHAFLLGCELQECDFSGSNLSGACFHSCWCKAAVFRNSKTGEGVQFTSCRLTKADLSGMDLRSSCFRDCNFNGAIMCGVNLSGCDLKGFDLSDVNFAGADLTGADLRGSLLDNVIFNGARLNKALFDGASGSTADFACADITGASFIGANLPHANFSAWVPSFASTGDGAISIVINFNEAVRAQGAIFERCRLEQAIFSLDISAAREYWERHATR